MLCLSVWRHGAPKQTKLVLTDRDCSSVNLCPDSLSCTKEQKSNWGREGEGLGKLLLCDYSAITNTLGWVFVFESFESLHLPTKQAKVLVLGQGVLVLVFPRALLSFTVWFSSGRRRGNAADIVRFQVFFKQSIYCVTLNPWVTPGPHSLRQGATDHFIIAA